MPKHPYSSYEHHPAWAVVRKALAELEQNGDLDISTADAYVVGFLLKALSEAGYLGTVGRPSAPRHNPYSISVVKKRPRTGRPAQPIAKISASLQQLSEDPPSYGKPLSTTKKIRASKKLTEVSQP
jgi:hypothetical protein